MLLPVFIVFYPFSTNSQSSLPSQVEHQCQNRMVKGGKKVILHLAYDQAEWSLSPYLSLWLSNFVCNFMKESSSDLCFRTCSPTALTNPRICGSCILYPMWIMYLIGGLDRYIDRCIDSILDRVSVDTRSSIDRYISGVSTNMSADSPLNDTHGVGRHIDRDTISSISVNYRLCIGWLSVKSRSTLDWVSIDVRQNILLA